MKRLEIIREQSAQDFMRAAGPLLYRREVENGLLLGLAESLVGASEPPKVPPLLLRIGSMHETLTVALQTPPHNLVLSLATNDQLEKLVEYLFEHQFSFPGVVGPKSEAENFARAWSSCNKCGYALGMGQKIYQVKKVIRPSQVPGQMRMAEQKDIGVVAQWLYDFAAESLPAHEHRPMSERLEQAQRTVAKKLAYIWFDQAQPVSIAHVSRPTQNSISIIAVFTPKEKRKKGYASAVVADLSQAMLSAGKKFCTLYTDLSNPTSNKIYQAIGYVEVSDSAYFVFS